MRRNTSDKWTGEGRENVARRKRGLAWLRDVREERGDRYSDSVADYGMNHKQHTQQSIGI